MKTATLLWLAALQLLIIGWVHNPFSSAERAHAPWLGDAEIDTFTVEDQDGTQRHLVRSDGVWMLEPEGLPGDGAKIDALLDRLAALSPTPPLATSEAAARRFAVAEADGFERRITLAAGKKSWTALLGRSQGPRHSALRWANEPEIYRAALTLADWPLALEDWIDRTLLALPEAQQGTLTVGSRVLTEADDASAVATLRQRLAALRVSRLASEAERDGAEAVASVSAEGAGDGGQAVSLRLARLGTEASPTGYILTSSARPETFYLAPYQGRPLQDALAALESTPSP
jgi:hypothetical protein